MTVKQRLTALLEDRDPMTNLSRGLVLFSGALLGTALVAWVAHLVSCPFTWRTGIVSLAVLERYPKSCETYLYLAAICVVPLAALGTLAAHLMVARVRPAARTADSLLHLVVPAWYLLAWNGSDDLRSVLLVPTALLIGLRAVLIPIRRSTRQAPGVARAEPPFGGRELPRPVASPVVLAALPAGPALGATLFQQFPDGAAILLGTAVATGAAVLLWLITSRAAVRLGAVRLRDALARDATTFLALVPLTLGWARVDAWQGIVLLAVFLSVKRMAWRSSGVTRTRMRRVWWAFLVPVILYAYLYQPAIARPLDLFEDGVRLVPAGEILRGERPFAQNFLYHGLFEDAWKSLLSFRLWGTSIASYARMDNVLAPLGTVAAYFLCWSVLRSPASGLAVATGLVLLGHEPPARFACAMGGLALLVTAARADRPRPAMVSGMLLSLAAVQSLESGAGGWVVAILFLTLWSVGGERLRSGRLWMALLMGGVAGALPFAAYLASTGSLMPGIRASLGLLLPLEDRLSTPFVPRVLHEAAGLLDWALPSRQAAKTLLLVAPLPLVVWAATKLLLLRVQRPWRVGELGLLTAAVGGFVLYRGVIQRPDTFHLNKMMIFTGLLWALAVWEAWKNRSAGWRGLAAGAVQSALLVPFLLLAIQVAFRGPAEALRARLRDSSAGMRVCSVPRAGDMPIPAEQAVRIEEIVSYLQENLKPDDAFFEFTLSGLLYFLADRPNPTPFPHSTMAGSTGEQRQVIGTLEQTQPRLALFPTGRWEQRYEEMGSYLRQPFLARYLYERYVPTELVAGFLVLQRRDELTSAHLASVRSCEWPEVDMGYLPVLYGTAECGPRGLASVARFTPAHIARQWTVTAGRVVTPGDGVFAECVGDSNGVELASAPILLDPLAVRWLEVTAGTTARRLTVEWTTVAPRGRGATKVVCRTAGYTERRHLLELGCVPTWTWSGGITQVRLRWPEPGCRVRLREISFLKDRRDAVTGEPRVEDAQPGAGYRAEPL